MSKLPEKISDIRIITLGLCSTLAFSAHGRSVEIPITTTNLDQYAYRFSISTNAVTGGVKFHVTITSKMENIHADSKVGLSIVTHAETPDGETGRILSKSGSIAGVQPEIPVTMKKHRRVWEADFTVSYELLEKPGLCFVFTEIAHTTIKGKSVAMPSADFYEVKLRHFLKQ
jgi:hypothetical protein